MLKARENEIIDMETGRQLAVVFASNVPKSTARRWAQYVVDRENSVLRAKGHVDSPTVGKRDE